jgi:hypothetical protein
MSKGKISIYACGGAGINIGKLLQETGGKFNSKAFAEREVYFVDTSKSNLAKVNDEEKIYLFEDVDGAGKVRKHVSEAIIESAKDILLRFKPADVSIVISSTSGGSGSVIAPTLVSELLARKEPVIYIGVASSDSKLEVKNNIDTIKSFARIANVRKRPVVGTLFENTPTDTQSDNNTKIRSYVIMLSALFSRNNEGLDTQDLRNWLNFTDVTDFEPSFAYLSVQVGKVTKVKDNHLISAAIISPGRDTDSSLGFEVDYQTVGYFSSVEAEGELNNDPVNYLIYTGPNEALLKKQERIMETLKEETSARVKRSSILSGDEEGEDNGLIV